MEFLEVPDLVVEYVLQGQILNIVTLPPEIYLAVAFA